MPHVLWAVISKWPAKSMYVGFFLTNRRRNQDWIADGIWNKTHVDKIILVINIANLTQGQRVIIIQKNAR